MYLPPLLMVLVLSLQCCVGAAVMPPDPRSAPSAQRLLDEARHVLSLMQARRASWAAGTGPPLSEAELQVERRYHALEATRSRRLRQHHELLAEIAARPNAPVPLLCADGSCFEIGVRVFIQHGRMMHFCVNCSDPRFGGSLSELWGRGRNASAGGGGAAKKRSS
jgi:hypothetical protein